MAKIRATWYQNGDMHKSVKIKRNIKLYHAKSYVMRVFLFNRMFKTSVVTDALLGNPARITTVIDPTTYP